jgi:tRNA(Ile)-lysidine synthase TilS/MesJ
MFSGIDNFIYLFSGGKDATVGLDLLQRYIYSNNIAIDIDVVMITYPHHVYFMEDGSPAKCYIDTLSYWKNRGIDIKICSPKTGDIKGDDPTACKTCKSARKSYVDPHIESHKAKYQGKKIGVITGYTLYDALAYVDEILLVSNFKYDNIAKGDNMEIRNRVLNCLHKIKAKEELPNE